MCTKWEKILRAQERRVDEVSVQKLRENHETIQLLTSQLQQMQEQMNPLNDSGDFQDVDSNYSGRLPQVSSQPALIPSSRALNSSATKDCRLTHGINQDYRKTFFLEINFLRLIHPEIILKEFNLTTCKETEKQSLKPERRRLNHGTIPMPTEKTAHIGIAIRQIPKSTIVFSVENSIQKSCDHLL